MKRKHKSYSRPKRPFDKVRINEEADIKKEFGLKNKKEIWKAESKIKKIREKAKKLISSSPEEQKILFVRLQKWGLNVNSIADVLSLETKDYLNRRLQTVLVYKKLANTPKMARQMIVHKKVRINGRAVNSPSYTVPVELENKITIKENKKKTKKEPVKENSENVSEKETGEKEND